MELSRELVALIEHAANRAVPSILGTDGPLASFVMIQSPDGQVGIKELGGATTDDDLVAAAATPGVMRFVFAHSGRVQTAEGEAPVVLFTAAERGDPSAYILAQPFVPGRSPAFGEPQGGITLLQGAESHFRHVPARVVDDARDNAIILQEHFRRFARRLVSRAFGDDDPEVTHVTFTLVDGEEAADASFLYRHGSGTVMKLSFELRDNVFAPAWFQEMDDQGELSGLDPELGDALLRAYGA